MLKLVETSYSLPGGLMTRPMIAFSVDLDGPLPTFDLKFVKTIHRFAIEKSLLHP